MILASKSPRRQELLKLIFPNFTIENANIDENNIHADTPCRLAEKLAVKKAQVVSLAHPNEWVIGCDTVVNLNGVALGKPKTEQEAIAMLTALAGNTHQVHTGVCIYSPTNTNNQTIFTESTHVTFSSISLQEITTYVQTGDCFNKAGGYGIQGQMAKFIPSIQGCYYNVMGLPVAAIYQHLKNLNALPK